MVVVVVATNGNGHDRRNDVVRPRIRRVAVPVYNNVSMVVVPGCGVNCIVYVSMINVRFIRNDRSK